MIHLKICRICAGVSGIWLLLSVLVAWHFISYEVFQLPIAILMGGSVVGIAYQRNSFAWKMGAIAIGMPAAYLLIINLTKTTVIIELIVLLVLAYVLFGERGRSRDPRVLALEKKMEQCC